MKPVYIFILLLITTITAAAQRSVDLKLTSFWSQTSTATLAEISTSDTLFVDGIHKYYFGYGISSTSLSQDSLALTDSIFIKRSSGDTFSTSVGAIVSSPIMPNDSVMYIITDSTIFVAGPGNPFPFQPYTWCDTLWAKDSTSGSNISDPDDSNNTFCKNITAHYIFTSVDGTVKEKDEAFILYPNPATSMLNIKFNFGISTTASVRVVDILGKEVYRQNLGMQKGVQDVKLNMSQVPKGLYHVQLITEKGTYIERLGVQ